MLYTAFCTFFITAMLTTSSVSAKTESLAERGKRMCAEAGVSLEDCTILPPAMRTAENGNVLQITPESRPTTQPAAAPAAFVGTGKYGWCDDCTSVIAAAPVTPWSAYAGRTPVSRDNGDDDRRQTASVEDPETGAIEDTDPGESLDPEGQDDREGRGGKKGRYGKKDRDGKKHHHREKKHRSKKEHHSKKGHDVSH